MKSEKHIKLSSLQWKTLLLLTIIATASATSLFAADKTQYHWFKPTPREWMRPLSTDRPDKTESAYTLDAGHFQIEMDGLNYSYDSHNTDRTNTRVETVNIAPVNLKVGVLHNLDLQLILGPYTAIRENSSSTGIVEKRRGFNDLFIRSKFNVWGNDGGRTALALMPVVKIPTNQERFGNRSVEGGLIIPLSVELPSDWTMGMMTEMDLMRNESDTGYHPQFINTVTFSHDICGSLGGYAEFFALVNEREPSNWEGTVDLGLTYGINQDIQLDVGANIGVTRSADDWNPFLGISWRF